MDKARPPSHLVDPLNLSLGEHAHEIDHVRLLFRQQLLERRAVEGGKIEAKQESVAATSKERGQGNGEGKAGAGRG